MIQSFAELTAVYKVFDLAADSLEKAIGVPTCVGNCGRCCQENTPLCMAIEAANMVSSLSMPQVTMALDIAEGWLTEPVEGVSIYRGVPRGLLPQNLVAEWKLVNKSQCPFLVQSSLCLIHQWRPLTCRAFGVFRDGVPLCPRPTGRGETMTQRAVASSEDASVLVREFRKQCAKRNPSFIIAGFVPTMLIRAARPQKLKELIDDNKIASARLVGVDINIDLLWQPQLDALRTGVGPMEVVRRSM